MEYKKRIIDKLIKTHMNSFGATLIIGPKGCGKSTTCKQFAKTIIEFQDVDKRENLILVANTKPSTLLTNPKPVLFDEWQDAPKIWGAIRKYCDDNPLEKGSFLLTGSSSIKAYLPHTGTLRITRLKMHPMSLYESNESSGEISLTKLFNNEYQNGFTCKSNLTIENLAYAICRGGWPLSILNKTKEAQLLVAKIIYQQTYEVDISNIDNVKRRPSIARRIIQTYSRNIATLVDNKKMFIDVSSNEEISEPTFSEYINALEDLFIIDNIPAWNPSIRSKTAIRTKDKKNLVDPSIAVAALGLSPERLLKDFKTFGFLFESLCIRDLKIYASSNNGILSHYRDRYNLECDAVLHLEDGRYALIEFKLGDHYVDEGAKHLLKIESLIKEHNNKELQCPLRLPDLKIVITASEYGYLRDDGVYVIPIGCLKD